MKRVAAVVLAAGASRRLGEPKQLIRLGAENLVERAVRVAREAGCSPLVVVLGAAAEAVFAGSELGDSVVVVNADWEEGMGASIACGIATVDSEVDAQVEGAVVLACDQPAVTSDHLRLLIAQGAEVSASGYAGRRGVPAYFPAADFEELMELRGDVGARGLLKGARMVELAGGELDVDTAGDLDTARREYLDRK